MAKGFLGIEIADKFIRYVYLERHGGTYQILKADKWAVTVDLSAPGSLSEGVAAILKKEGIAPQRIFVTISRRDIVIHQIVLPELPKAELGGIVEEEIEKLPVFHHRTFDYIFYSYRFRKEKIRVIFGAIAQDVLDVFLNEIEKTRIFFRDLEISPLNIKELLPTTKGVSKKEAADGGPVSAQALLPENVPLKGLTRSEALLVVYDRHTYFSIIENRQYKFFYRSAMGADSFAASSPDLGRDHIFSNWTAELGRVLKAYLSEDKKTTIEKLWVIWDSEAEPQLAQRISADLHLPVELLELSGVKNITTSPEVTFNPAYWVALTPIVCHVNNIRTPFPLDHFFRSFHIKRFLVNAVAAAAVFLIVAGAFSAGIVHGVKTRTQTLSAETQDVVQETGKRRTEAKDLFVRHKEYLMVRQRLLDQATYVHLLNRVSWAQVLAVVAQELPEKMALTSFKFNESGSAEFKGDTFEMDSIAAMIRRVDTSSILQNGKFDFLQEKEHEELKYLSFGILARLQDMRDKFDDNEPN